MKKFFLTCALSILAIFSCVMAANADLIDFTGGTVHKSDGKDAGPTNNSSTWLNVDYYIQDGFRFDFVGADGIIGDYYSSGSNFKYLVGNDVLHAHWKLGVTSVVITRVDGKAFDLEYIDVTSNTSNDGGQATGNESTYITTNNGDFMKLPSSAWGFAHDDNNVTGDGTQRLWLDDHFNNITSVTFTSQNAYCFGLDSIYVQETPVPIPAAVWLFGSGLLGLFGVRRRIKK